MKENIVLLMEQRATPFRPIPHRREEQYGHRHTE